MRSIPRPAALLLCFYLLGDASSARADSLRTNELGLRYWHSSGRTDWNHTADSPLLGDPTSVLSYERLGGRTAELHFRRAISGPWFVRGALGMGEVRRGSLDDEDYAAGQVRFSDTASAVRGGSLRYLTLDAGTLLTGGRVPLHVFAGYQYWSERLEAYGLTNAPGFFAAPSLGQNVPVISNEVRWLSLRAGIGATYAWDRFGLSVDVAHVPYTSLHNRDSHYLRADLGGVPNIHMNARGRGWQLDAEVRRWLTRNASIGVGVRYWVLEADGKVNFGGSAPLPLNRIRSERGGITASLIWKF